MKIEIKNWKIVETANKRYGIFEIMEDIDGVKTNYYHESFDTLKEALQYITDRI